MARELHTIIAESIAAILSTRQGERVMLPDYGLPDYVFDAMDNGFAARLRYIIEQQIMRYEPLVERVTVSVNVEDAHAAMVEIEYVARGTNSPRNLTFPLWVR
ncbi:MAG: GPW/gp25 family protein [Chloroflexi bacterium]|nr:GPW/gp25 family protein [Chloroflexota bacterium]